MSLIIIAQYGNIFVKLIIMVLQKYENIPAAKIFPFYRMVYYKVLYYSKSYKLTIPMQGIVLLIWNI